MVNLIRGCQTIVQSAFAFHSPTAVYGSSRGSIPLKTFYAISLSLVNVYLSIGV